MRALTRGERQASLAAALGLLGLACALVASLGLNLKHAGDLDRLHHAIYAGCLDRAAYDRAANAARLVEIQEWRALAGQQQLDARSGAAYTRMADAMQAAVDAQVRGTCAVYR